MKARPAHWWLALIAPILGVLYLVVCPPSLLDAEGAPPLPSLPGAAARALAERCGLSALAQLYLARAGALAVYLLAAVSAAALANSLGWLVFALALTPGVLLRAACNGHTLLADALALLLLASAVRVAGSTAATRRSALLLKAALLGSCTLIAAQWLYDARPLPPLDGSLVERLTWPLRQPWKALRMLRLTLFRRGDEAALELLVLPTALTQQFRFLGAFVATLHGQLLCALAAGALHATLPRERAKTLIRGALLAALLYAGAVGVQLLVAERELRPPVLESFTGAPFFPVCVALLLALAAAARPIAARWLSRRPVLAIVLPLLLLHAYLLAALTARFQLAPTLAFPY